MRRKYQEPPPFVKDGAAVWYHPVIGEPTRYAFTVRGEPWQLGHGEWVVRLDGSCPEYIAWTGRERPAGGVVMAALESRQ